MFRLRCNLLLFLSVNFALFFTASAIAQQMNNITGGSARDFQVTVTNSFGVRNTIDANSNVRVRNSATVNLLPGSYIDDSFGDSKGNANANFTVTPGGGNMSINGIQSRNVFLFGAGTQFTSEMESVENPDPSKPIKGTASSMATHELNIKVQQQQSAFSSSFSQNF
ncbi:hypothetical protein FZZ91_04250 [Synechococcus sp. HB1133]|uniref:hypothetical protein n=1 Tax=unclassified Synechococcus TaxID=2626047 RepID=UPI0014099C64|nr:MULTISPECIES: hypothetical protein [unclassified Synechococcus]MCB4394721.1 hypothetical protein [Synechococcus sp. PH41509]MCB4422052.1 hypothetical protein [Synechococcus sp. HB1133]MCB4430000.1 hypothetical protein [Synechococcus sp. HBA1120]NHI80995.1 hypothetical protein [Synechococcus sp. HB1133]